MGLKDLDQEYDKTAPKEGATRDAVPPGSYQAKLFKMDIQPTKKAPIRDMLILELEIISGKQAKRRVWKNCMLTTENLEYLKADLFALGYKGKISDLENPQVRLTLLDRVVNITVKHKGEYNGQPNIQVYLNSSQVGPRDLPNAGTVKANPAAKSAAADGSDEPPF